MVRALLLIIAILILVAIALVMTGVIGVSQTQNAQAPKFTVDVNPVDVGTRTANVQVPAVGLETKQVEVPTVSVGNGSANSQ